jgi:hypothetical protein
VPILAHHERVFGPDNPSAEFVAATLQRLRASADGS